MLVPGRVVCVSADSGGYQIDRGFNAKSDDPVEPVPRPTNTDEAKESDKAEGQQNAEVPGETWKTIACHTREVREQVTVIAQQLQLPDPLQKILHLAADWHDWGKAHPAFQGAMRDSKKRGTRPKDVLLAKAPKDAWRKGREMYRYLDSSETRPAFRHELASALGLIALLQTYAPQHPALLGPWTEVLKNLNPGFFPSLPVPVPSALIQRVIDTTAEQFDLMIYLVVAHHGKVRVALHAAPADQDYHDLDGRGLPIRGIREGDQLPSVTLVPGEPTVPAVTLTLSPAGLGLSEKTGISWRERSMGVIDRYGPAGLAFLEAILRAADVRASRLTTPDPLLPPEARP